MPRPGRLAVCAFMWRQVEAELAVPLASTRFFLGALPLNLVTGGRRPTNRAQRYYGWPNSSSKIIGDFALRKTVLRDFL